MVAVLSVSQWLLVETSVMESFTLSQVWSLILTSLHKLLNTRLLENVIFLCCRPPVSRQLEVIKLAVDSTSEQKAAPRTPTSDSPLDTLYIGGRIHHSVFNPCNKTCWRKILLLVYLWVCTWRCLSFFFSIQGQQRQTGSLCLHHLWAACEMWSLTESLFHLRRDPGGADLWASINVLHTEDMWLMGDTNTNVNSNGLLWVVLKKQI